MAVGGDERLVQDRAGGLWEVTRSGVFPPNKSTGDSGLQAVERFPPLNELTQ